MFGLPELGIVLAITTFSLLPAAAVVWALVMLHRIRADQREIKERLDEIEGRLKGVR